MSDSILNETNNTPEGSTGPHLHVEAPKRRRWLTPVLVTAALFAGIGIGNATGSDTTPTAETAAPTTAPAKDEPAEEPADEVEPEPEPVEEDGPAVGAIGDTTTITSYDETIGTITVSDLKISTVPAVDYGDGPKNGNFLVFDVQLTADATMDVYDDDFYIKTKDGTRIDHLNGNAWDAVDETLGYAELNAGEQKTGFLAFDVGVKHGELVYSPNYDGGPIASWTF